MRSFLATAIAAASLGVVQPSRADGGELQIPGVVRGDSRPITVADIAGVRKVGSLSVSPDGKRYAIFVAQGDAVANDYRTGWFVGDVSGGPLTPLGDGGNVRYAMRPNGTIVGEIETRESRWSPDGAWIAYVRRVDGEIQAWRGNVRTGAQEQLTHNNADVRDFDWSEDGRALYFKVGTPRDELRRKEQERSQRGYRYDEELMTFADPMMPERRAPLETDLKVWIVTLQDGHERPATDAESKAFDLVRAQAVRGKEDARGYATDATVPPVISRKGAAAWLSRTQSASMYLRVMTQSTPQSQARACEAEACLGRIERVWWNDAGTSIYFSRHEGVNGMGELALYAWSPAKAGAVRRIARSAGEFRACTPAVEDRLVCIRETTALPSHVASTSMRSGRLNVLADVNPEFASIRLGKIESIEWDTPKLAWNEPGGEFEGLYPKRAAGYVLYPPDYDPAKKYPVFIEPYVAHGFNATVGGEHALLAYAANDIIVLNLSFPNATDVGAKLGGALMARMYSKELDFPHLTMLMESTRLGLEAATAKGFVDTARVGIGGVSHGTFVPLYLMQHHDRIAAISISSAHWGPHEYYMTTASSDRATRQSRGAIGYEEWRPKPVGEGREYWDRIDASEHVDQIEGPVLMNLSAGESYALLKLIRHLRDAQLPYDAYIFDKETHLKWQPAHLRNVMTRNLDWFRFWLQDIEDPDPLKADQYSRWRQLREQQCKNPHAMRDYCQVASREASPVR
jgi:dipeptidyl aminopeptidase/acylaminoacyl peptidase